MSRHRRGSTRRHRVVRALLLANLRDGQPCFRCQQPMHRWQRLDADHTRTLATLDPGAPPDALSHAPCNQVHGAAMSSALRGVTERAERQRIADQVTERVHHHLRHGLPVARAKGKRTRPRPTEPRIRRVSSW